MKVSVGKENRMAHIADVSDNNGERKSSGMCGEREGTWSAPAFFNIAVSVHRSNYCWHFRGIYCCLAGVTVGMKPPEGRSQPFNGPMLLKRDKSGVPTTSGTFLLVWTYMSCKFTCFTEFKVAWRRKQQPHWKRPHIKNSFRVFKTSSSSLHWY